MKHLLPLLLLCSITFGQTSGGSGHANAWTFPGDATVVGEFMSEEIYELPLTFGMKGSMPTPAPMLGMNDIIAAGLTATDGTERMVGNNHVLLVVNSITGSGVVVVTGDSTSESDGSVDAAITENLTVDATGSYQTNVKWQRITDVTIPGGISAINYDINRLGYWDHSNGDFRITGYRMEVTPTNATNADFQIQIFKVQDDGAKKTTIVTMEDMKVSGTTPWLDDALRANARDYTTATATLLKVGVPHVLKQGDFSTYFSSDENIMESAAKHEGIYVVVTWDNIDFMTGILYFKHGTG